MLNLERSLGWSVGLLAAVFVLFEITPLDLWVQDRLFDFQRGAWLIDGREPVGRILFYTGPKAAVIAFGVLLLVSLALPTSWRTRLPVAFRSRSRGWVLFLTLGLVPSVIGWSKSATNVFCPSEIRRYGGDVPYVRVLESYPAADRPQRRGRCFPGGHASGGFALLALAGLAHDRRRQLLGIGIGLSVGSLMGFYQMAKGAHYLSHTLITALVAWIVFLLLHKAVGVVSQPGHTDRFPFIDSQNPQPR